MISDQIKWDLRHKEEPTNSKPLALLVESLHKIYGRDSIGAIEQDLRKQNLKALDIACGMGRNSLFLRDCGFYVESVDISKYAIENLQNKERINAQCVDLDTFKIPVSSYDVICNSYFLERRLFPYMIEGLKKDGILIFETFAKSSVESHNAFVSDSSHLLRKNELLYAFLGLEILFYEESLMESNRNSKALVVKLVARKT